MVLNATLSIIYPKIYDRLLNLSKHNAECPNRWPIFSINKKNFRSIINEAQKTSLCINVVSRSTSRNTNDKKGAFIVMSLSIEFIQNIVKKHANEKGSSEYTFIFRVAGLKSCRLFKSGHARQCACEAS